MKRKDAGDQHLPHAATGSAAPQRGPLHAWGGCPRDVEQHVARPLAPARRACPSCMRRSTALLSSTPRTPPPPRASRVGGGAHTMPLAIAQRRKAGLWAMLQPGRQARQTSVSRSHAANPGASTKHEAQPSSPLVRSFLCADLQAQARLQRAAQQAAGSAPDACRHPEARHEHPGHHHPRHGAQQALRDLACSRGGGAGSGQSAHVARTARPANAAAALDLAVTQAVLC